MYLPKFVFSSVLMVLSLSALAGGKEDASAHFQAIAKGDVGAVTAAYAEQAVFQWVGGPLDGAYNGPEAITGVWTKFTKANGPMTAEVDGLTEASNPKGSTVTANVTFKGKNMIKVLYVLTYRDGKLVNETWQINPGM